jgi:uncharacterized repeat protein (TIGR01451 family)
VLEVGEHDAAQPAEFIERGETNMKAATSHPRGVTWLLMLVAAVVATALFTSGVATAQEAGGSASASDHALASKIFLPLLGNDSPPASMQVLDDPAVGLAVDGNIDGAWSLPRNDQGVTPVSCESIDNSSDDTTNENLVRYGQPIGAADCGATTFRSGFGFDGANIASFAPNQPFLLGRFTHYNNSIVTPLVPMQFVDLSLHFQTPALAIDAIMTYTMRLDETINEGECLYGATNPGLCDDKVDFVNNTSMQTLVVDGVTYTLNILGFVPGAPESCQYSPTLADAFITGEIMQNDACVFAQFVTPQPALSITKSPDLQKIVAGDNADFTITVRNSGNVGLSNITIADPLTPDCERDLDELKAGASFTHICTATGIEQDFENVATATGYFAGTAFKASDQALVDVLAPDSATLFAYKYHDLDGNGQRNAGEPGLPGWTFCVRDANGVNVGLCQSTDIDGFAILAPNQGGDFQLCEVAQSGWANTDPVSGSGCKPVAVTQAPRYAELYPTTGGIYGIELTEKSSDQLRWTYTVYQFLNSQPPDAWVLALPTCIDAAQIDPAGTTTGWSFVTDNTTGLRGLRWPAAALPVEGMPFNVAFRQAYPTGAARGGVITGGATPAGASDVVAGPVCDPPVLLGNRASTAANSTLEVRKIVLPASDSGRFNLLIDGQVSAADIQNGGSTGAQPVTAGIHTVGESAGALTTLDDYQSSLRCVETGSGSAWTPDATGRVSLDAGDAVVCTFTNIRRGAITIVKQATGTATADWAFGGGLGDFTLPAAGGQRAFTRLAPGVYNVAESSVAGWALSALSCADPGFDSQTNLATGVAAINLAPGETVTCTFANVQQTGAITVIKQVNGTATAPWYFTGALGDFTFEPAGGTRSFANLAPGQYTVRELAAENWRVSAITCVDPDGATTVDLVNAAAAIDLDGGEAVTCTFVNQPGAPAIALEKRASVATIYSGTNVTYTFAVSNPGAVTLGNVRIDDPLCPVTPMLAGAVNSGDADADGALDPGETWRYTCTTVLTQDTTNTATASGSAPWGEQVWAQASAAVDVITPALTVDKVADQTQVAPGTAVNFRITVRNRGDVPLFNIAVIDDQSACTLSAPTGDDGNTALDPGEGWVYTCALVITTDTVNSATAAGYDRLNTRWVATASASVTVIRSAIELGKTVDKAHVYPGEGATFTVRVHNTGGSWLQKIAVSDSLPECRLAGPVGDDGDGRLAVGEAWSYTCAVAFCTDPHFALPAGFLPAASGLPTLCADVTNTATVTAEDPLGQPVSATGSAAVDLIRPAIQVTKLADKTYVSPGELVNFSIYVKNTGDTPLMDVTLTDSLPGCAVGAPAGDDGDEVLAPAEEWLYTCAMAVEVETVNTARAVAKDLRGTSWQDEDSVTIAVCLE